MIAHFVSSNSNLSFLNSKSYVLPLSACTWQSDGANAAVSTVASAPLTALTAMILALISTCIVGLVSLFIVSPFADFALCAPSLELHPVIVGHLG